MISLYQVLTYTIGTKNEALESLKFHCSGDRIRTDDQVVNSHLLYR